jgi:hypothetical protein
LVELAVMRKFLISLMAASMLVPAAAQAEDDPVTRAQRSHAERSGQRDDNADNRSPRSRSAQGSERSDSDRPVRVERAPREDRASRAERVQRIDRADDGGSDIQRVERVRREDPDVRHVEGVRRNHRDEPPVQQVQVDEPVQPVPEVERRREDPAGALQAIGRDTADVRTGDRDGDRDRRDWRRDRDGDRDGRDWRRDGDGRHRWDRDWRRNGRYDWSRHRHRYGTLFRLGRYYDPYGWGYRRFSIGYSLWPSYYGSSFWLNDPWDYRLPPVYGPYRWVRYFDDALLVNIYTGHVVDVVYNIFW